MKLAGLAWKPGEIALRWFDRSILAICLMLQLLVWALLAIGAFWLHWTIGIVIVCWIFLAPMTLLMQIRVASRTEEQPPYLVAPPSGS
jgi:predicted MFS family arabinose efflux permease